MAMFGTMKRSISAVREYVSLTPAARAEVRSDRRGLPPVDPGIDRAIEAAVGWLIRAQDCSASRDSGVARHFSLLTGWSESYPETTGYIIPTLFVYARTSGHDAFRQRAQRMLDWLVSIQLPDGGFQGGTIYARPPVSVTFNTGQILLGLASGTRELGTPTYRSAMCRAADWLVQTQDPDGCWRRRPSPFTAPGEKAYEMHVAWGLMEAARLEPDKAYGKAALANVRWALQFQQDNGWFDKCCLEDAARPLTHTLGYALRGLVEAYRFAGDQALLVASLRTADGLLSAMRNDGFLPGRLDRQWQGAAPWACLTGTEQIAQCWFMLAEDTGQAKFREAAFAANRFVRRTIRCDGPPDTRGGVKGSFPVYGAYGKYQYLNWACKFFIDANVSEKAVREGRALPE